jgi:hypothetical protein
MRKDVGRTELQEQTQQLLQGPLKHARAAALSLALVPLAAVGVAGDVQTSELCFSAGVCGVVFYDNNNSGTQDGGDTPIQGAVVTLTYTDGSGTTMDTATGSDGAYFFSVPEGTYEVSVQIPPLTSPATSNSGGDDAMDSDGMSDGEGHSEATSIRPAGDLGYDSSTDFGFVPKPTNAPGTGTPGYWKNHPEAWPASITVGGATYTRDQALAFFGPVSKDKRVTLFQSLVSAMLNVGIGNDSSCVSGTITDANAWLATYGAPGTANPVNAASYAWKVGEPLHRKMDNYNNGMLCAPHRD